MNQVSGKEGPSKDKISKTITKINVECDNGGKLGVEAD